MEKIKRKNKILWINFLHFYQPANADAHVIEEATNKSYIRVIRALEKHPNIKFTINITGCLFLRWDELGYHDLIKRIKKLVKRKQLEIVGSASYHPILPLVPEKEVKKQVKHQELILKKYLGVNLKPKGFFFPEMAYSSKVGKVIKKMGYKWIILDEISHSGKLNGMDYNKIYKDKVNGLKIIFRSRKLSKSYVPDKLRDLIKENIETNTPLITATDAELYGLRHIDPAANFEKLLKYPKLNTLTISEFISNKVVLKIKPISSNWETTEEDIKKKIPFALWSDKKNMIQKNLWELADLAYKTIDKHKKNESYHWADWHLVRGMASCTFWWASAKDFRLYGPISWSPDEIERGTNEFIRSIRALDDENTRQAKIKAEKLYIKIKQMVWHKHWNYYWNKK